MDLGEGSGEQGPHRGRALGDVRLAGPPVGHLGLGTAPLRAWRPPKRLGAGWNVERRGQPRSELRSSCWATHPLAARPGPGATPPGAPAARSRLSLSSRRRKAEAQPAPAELLAQHEEEPATRAGGEEEDAGQDTWVFEADE